MEAIVKKKFEESQVYREKSFFLFTSGSFSYGVKLQLRRCGEPGVKIHFLFSPRRELM